MADLPPIVKEGSGPLALAGLVAYAFLTFSGAIPTDGSKAVDSLAGMVRDQDKSVTRIWDYLNKDREDRKELVRDLNKRISEAERQLDRQDDRLADQRAILSTLQANTSAMNKTINEIHRVLDTVNYQLRVIARQTGVEHHDREADRRIGP